MCGIGGFRRYYNAPPVQQEQVDLMLVGLQNRGVDATGVALLNINKKGEAIVYVHKDNIPSWDYVGSDGYQNFMKEYFTPETNTILLHTRAASEGFTPMKMENNHPMFKDKVAVVHNGTVSNHSKLFVDMQLERNAETDSDILRAIMDSQGFTKKAIRDIGRCQGAIACAAIDPTDPTHTLFVRSGSPLVMAKQGDLLIWASERRHIYTACRGQESWLGMEWSKANSGLSFIQMRDHSAWIFGPDGVEWHDQCQTAFSNWTEPRRHIFEGYCARKAKWLIDESKKNPTVKVKTTVVKASDTGNSAKTKRPIRIPCKKCNKLNKLPCDSYQGIDLATVKCGNCETLLLSKAPKG